MSLCPRWEDVPLDLLLCISLRVHLTYSQCKKESRKWHASLHFWKWRTSLCNTPSFLYYVWLFRAVEKGSVSLVGKLGLIGRSIKTPVHPELWWACNLDWGPLENIWGPPAIDLLFTITRFLDDCLSSHNLKSHSLLSCFVFALEYFPARG
jgi:hypothetical protein